MSAFIIDDNQISAIASFIDDARIERVNLMHWYVQDAQNEFNVKFGNSAKEIGNELFQLNCISISQRYRAEDIDQFSPDAYEYKRGYSRIMSVYKCLQSLLYQSSEGYVRETRLFKALKYLSAQIAHKIVQSTTEYEVCSW